MTQNLEDSFDYISLKDVDPNDKAFPDKAAFRLQIVKAGIAKGVSQAGNSYTRLDFQFSVVGDATYGGRRVFMSFFAPVKETQLKGLRRMADAVGMLQGDQEPFSAWCERLAATRPEFEANVVNKAKRVKDAATGEYVDKVDPASGEVVKEPQVELLSSRAITY